MQNTRLIAAMTALCFGLSAGPVGAGSVAGFGGSTEITQLANNIELVNSYLQQVDAYATQLRQYQTQIQQYQNMVQNTLALPQQVWGRVHDQLMGVANVVRQGQALAYSAANIGEQFENTFKGFRFPTNFNYKAEYRKWSTTTLDSLKSALAGVKVQADNFADEEATLVRLRDLSSSSSGQLQAIQAGSQIAEQQVQQLQKLRQLMMLQLQSQNAYLAAQESKDASMKAAKADAFDYQDPRNETFTSFRGGSR